MWLFPTYMYVHIYPTSKYLKLIKTSAQTDVVISSIYVHPSISNIQVSKISHVCYFIITMCTSYYSHVVVKAQGVTSLDINILDDDY